ncbi:hypothetical protein L7F22_019087 [Adiantum nelumboides]|nr:hypothetical protein [Adiantum nelumboides]
MASARLARGWIVRNVQIRSVYSTTTFVRTIHQSASYVDKESKKSSSSSSSSSSSWHTSSIERIDSKKGKAITKDEKNSPSINLSSAEEETYKPKSLTSEWEGKRLTQEQMNAAKHFYNLGIQSDLCNQLVSTNDHIQKPTLSQAIFLKSIRKQSDIIFRAGTGSGKSFVALLSALNKTPDIFDKVREEMKDGFKIKKVKNIQTIIVVPTRELALQYGNWSKALVPESIHEKLKTIVDVRYYSKQVTAREHLKELHKQTPTILVITAKLLWQLLQEKDADRFLIRNLKMLVLDEVDEMLNLPGKFPNQKVIWRHSKHPPPGLELMKKIMSLRKTHSSGKILPMSGLEDEKQLNRIPKDVRDRTLTIAKSIERKQNVGEEEDLPRFSTTPLQLVLMSATANAVLRHFFGARTGWLRTGIRDPITKNELGKWIDTTGLSNGVKKADEMEGVRILPIGTSFPVQIPKEINHFSVVIDDVPTQQDQDQQQPSIGWRNLKNLKSNDDSEKRRIGKMTNDKSELKTSMLTCLAFIFATQGVRKGMLVIPDSFSLTEITTFLRQIGVPVKPFHEFQSQSETEIGEEDEFLLVTSKSTIRGLDVPGGLTHIFILGLDAIGDATTYTHIAGRVSRLGKHTNDQQQEELHQRPLGSVITLLHGLNKQDSIQDGRYAYKLLKDNKNNSSKFPFHSSQEEVKMSSIFKQLSIPLQTIKPLKSKLQTSDD